MWRLFGTLTNQRENNIGLSASTQRTNASQVVYETDNIEEARTIVDAGGFINDRTGQWVVVSHMVQDHPDSNALEKPLSKTEFSVDKHLTTSDMQSRARLGEHWHDHGRKIVP